MVKRSTRWRKLPPKVLSSPTSARVIECYAAQGKGEIFTPLIGEVATLILVNAQHETAFATTRPDRRTIWQCSDAPPGDWRVLGWVPGNGPRHGPYDIVDPTMADYEQLPTLNRVMPGTHSTPIY